MLLHLLNNSEKAKFLELALYVANIDNNFNKQEKEKIKEICKEIELECNKFDSKINIDEIINFFAKSEDFKKKIVFIEILCLMLVDGIVKEEKAFLEKLKEHFQLDDEFESKVISWCQEFNKIKLNGFLLLKGA
jgi:uncharacterized tellurite resistance protein B-like protein